MTGIPKILHYSWLAKPGSELWRLPVPLYICMASALRHIRPERTILWADHPPAGWHWDLLRDRIEVRPLETDVRSWGRKPIRKTIHKSDKVRLDVLSKYGGIYLDLDVLVLRPFDDLLDGIMTMGAEGDYGLGSAVIISRKDDPFLGIWMDHYERWFDPNGWAEACVHLSRFLADCHGELIRVLPETAFFHPPWWESRRIFEEPQVVLPESYAVHLWATTCRDFLEGITESSIRSGSSHFDRIAREYI